MYCSTCGKELPYNANFCPVCGAVINPPAEQRTGRSSLILPHNLQGNPETAFSGPAQNNAGPHPYAGAAVPKAEANRPEKPRAIGKKIAVGIIIGFFALILVLASAYFIIGSQEPWWRVENDTLVFDWTKWRVFSTGSKLELPKLVRPVSSYVVITNGKYNINADIERFPLYYGNKVDFDGTVSELYQMGYIALFWKGLPDENSYKNKNELEIQCTDATVTLNEDDGSYIFVGGSYGAILSDFTCLIEYKNGIYPKLAFINYRNVEDWFENDKYYQYVDREYIPKDELRKD